MVSELPPDKNISIDQKSLDVIRALDNNGKPVVLCKVIDIFLKNSPDQLQTLRKRIQAGDPELIYVTAHSLKSSCAMLGAMRLSELFKEMELKGRINALENILPLMAQIDKEFESARADLIVELGKCKL